MNGPDTASAISSGWQCQVSRRQYLMVAHGPSAFRVFWSYGFAWPQPARNDGEELNQKWRQILSLAEPAQSSAGSDIRDRGPPHLPVRSGPQAPGVREGGLARHDPSACDPARPWGQRREDRGRRATSRPKRGARSVAGAIAPDHAEGKAPSWRGRETRRSRTRGSERGIESLGHHSLRALDCASHPTATVRSRWPPAKKNERVEGRRRQACPRHGSSRDCVVR